MRRKKLLTLTGSVCLILVLAALPFMTACPAPPAEEEGPPAEEEEAPPEPLKIGLNTSLTGPGAYWAKMALHSYEMWADDVNAEGGLLVAGVRHPVEIIAEDNKFTADGALASAEKLIFQDKVKIIVGAIFAHTYKAYLSLAERNNVITIGNSQDVEGVIGPEHPYSFISCTNPTSYIRGELLWFRDNKGVRSIYFLYVNSADGKLGMERTKKIAEDQGFAFSSAAYEEGTSDFYPVATAVVAANPDLVDLGVTAPEPAALATKALRGLGYEGLIFQEGGLGAKDLVAIAGAEVMEGFYSGFSPVSREEDWPPEKKQMVILWEEKYGSGSWDDLIGEVFLPAPYLLGIAIQEAGTIDDVDKIVEALENAELTAPWVSGHPIIKLGGAKTYGAKRIILTPVTMVTMHNGEWDIDTRIRVEIVCP